jgi:hypothetical protein
MTKKSDDKLKESNLPAKEAHKQTDAPKLILTGDTGKDFRSWMSFEGEKWDQGLELLRSVANHNTSLVPFLRISKGVPHAKEVMKLSIEIIALKRGW